MIDLSAKKLSFFVPYVMSVDDDRRGFNFFGLTGTKGCESALTSSTGFGVVLFRSALYWLEVCDS